MKKLYLSIILIILLILPSCSAHHTAPIYQMKKGESKHEIYTQLPFNPLMYSYRNALTDNLELGGHLGIASIGLDFRYHLLNTNNNLLSVQAGITNYHKASMELQYTLLNSKIGIRVSAISLYYNHLFAIFKDELNEKKISEDNYHYNRLDYYLISGFGLAIGDKKKFVEIKILPFILKSKSSEHSDTRPSGDIPQYKTENDYMEVDMISLTIGFFF